jgi:hypothetical protein
MDFYGLIVKGAEMRSGSPGNPVIAKEGTEFWVTIEPEGWVEATSSLVTDRTKVPHDLKIWKTKDDAVKFAKRWKGHPWWCSPVSHEVVKVNPKFKEIFDGYGLTTI